jgi:nucleoside-diphosphate-sugar epimerase
MKVLAAGAGGALGRQLVPRLVAAGHEVVGMTRSPGKRDAITALGANTVIADALECDQVAHAVAEAEPEAIVHELKALSGSLDMRHFDRDFESTNRLRTDATNHLLLAGRAVGVHRFVAQSYAGWPFARVGGPVKTEEDPLDPTPVESMRRTLEAIGRLEEAVTGASGPRGSPFATAASTAPAPRWPPAASTSR